MIETVRLRMIDLPPCDRLHVWKGFMEDVWGFHSKRDERADVNWYFGDTRICVFCASLLFHPRDKSLSPVPCVMVDSSDGVEIRIHQIQAA